MYIVISNPKRISVKSGLVHMVPTSGTIVGLLISAGTDCTGAPYYMQHSCQVCVRIPDPVTIKSFSRLPAGIGLPAESAS